MDHHRSLSTLLEARQIILVTPQSVALDLLISWRPASTLSIHSDVHSHSVLSLVVPALTAMEVFNKALASPDYGEYHVDHPTAQQIVDREDLTGKLTDKVMLITGATSGVGVETARVLHLTGAHLFLAIRDMAKGEQVKRDIETSSGQGKGKIDLPHVDLESLDSVRQCAADFLSKSKQLNVLVCNAGVLGPPNVRTTDGLETTFGVNHVAHFLLFQLLKAALLSSSTPSFNSRVVMLSSTGHQFSPVLIDDLDLSKHGYSVMVAYGSSKTANVYMALEIDRRYGSRNLHSTALHPGSVPSLLGRHLDTAMIQHLLTEEHIKSMTTVDQGAATTVWAAVSRDWEGKGGKYLEDVAVSKPKEECTVDNTGYAAHIYDTDAAQRLWTESLRLVGIEDDSSA